MEEEFSYFETPIRYRKRVILTYLIITLATLGAIFSTYVIFIEFPFQKTVRAIFYPSASLAGESYDRVNVLILGMGGAGHEGPYLTDTIILASFKPSTKELALLSIPRDLYVPIPGQGWGKINRTASLAEEEVPGSGVEASLTARIISQIFDLPVHYWVLVDFTGFSRVIDELGGIDVYVERTFIDQEYPTADFEYRIVFFKEGTQTMSGARALEFVRSRHGTAGEGSDFSRSRRQQKVILAVLKKATSLKLLVQPRRLASILKNLERSVKTNLEEAEMIRLAKLIQDIEEERIINRVIDGGEILYEGWAADGSYVLKAKSGDFSQLRELAKDIFNNR